MMTLIAFEIKSGLKRSHKSSSGWSLSVYFNLSSQEVLFQFVWAFVNKAKRSNCILMCEKKKKSCKSKTIIKSNC